MRKLLLLHIFKLTYQKKGVYLIIFTLFALTRSYSQITLTGADLPQGENAYLINVDTIYDVDISAPSNLEQNWDFSFLQTHYYRYAVYSTAGEANHNGASFPNSNLYAYGYAWAYGGLAGSIPMDFGTKGYMYFSSDNSGLKIVGFVDEFSTGNEPIVQEPDELLLGIPVSLDSIYNNDASWSVHFNSNSSDYDTSYTVYIHKTLTCDAFGSITTPAGTFEVLRIHENFIKTDTIRITYWGYEVDKFSLNTDTLNNYHFWESGRGYPVMSLFTDNNNSIIRTEYLSYDFPAYKIRGNVLSTSGTEPIMFGEVNMIIKDDYNHLFEVYETVPVDNQGRFEFSSMPEGNFLIYANPDNFAYPYNLSTYYGNSKYWQDASILSLNQDTSITINLQNDSTYINMSGNGNISGNISEGAFKSIATRAENIKIVLEENPGGATIFHDEPDDNGDFGFSNLEEGSYQLHVEIPGLEMDSIHVVNITSDSLYYQGLDYVYDTLMIKIPGSSSIKNYYAKDDFNLKVCPNPFNEQTRFVLNNDAYGNYELNIYDLSGKKVELTEGYFEKEILYQNTSLEKGIYLYKIIINGKLYATGRICIF